MEWNDGLASDMKQPLDNDNNYNLWILNKRLDHVSAKEAAIDEGKKRQTEKSAITSS